MTQNFTGQLRRLPVYLLLDCSSSMAGAPIIAVNEGLELLYRLLMKDPQARETAWLSLIRFASSASQDALTPVDQFIPPTLQASGGTAMGAAFTILLQSIKQDLQVSVQGKKGDYCPLVILLTDGQPGDEWRSPVQQLKALSGSQRPTIVALGCGNDAKAAMLAEVTEKVYMMGVVTADELRAFFQLISGSIVQSSRTPNASGDDLPIANFASIAGVQKYNG